MLPTRSASPSTFSTSSTEQNPERRISAFEKAPSEVAVKIYTYLPPSDVALTAAASTRINTLCTYTFFSQSYAESMPNYLHSIGIKNRQLAGALRDRSVPVRQFFECMSVNKKEIEKITLMSQQLIAKIAAFPAAGHFAASAICVALSLKELAIRTSGTPQEKESLQSHYFKITFALQFMKNILENLKSPTITGLYECGVLSGEDLVSINEAGRRHLVKAAVSNRLLQKKITVAEICELDDATVERWTNDLFSSNFARIMRDFGIEEDDPKSK